MGKKKKKSAAQAAAARHEKTEADIVRDQAKERGRLIRESAQNAQRQANKTAGFRMILPFILIGVLIVFALVFTIGPGMLMGS